MPGADDANRAFAVVLVDELARHGIRDAVLAPGSRSTPVALALHENARIRLHVRIDERSAAFLALGLARASGLPVPVLCTSGTATAHFHAAAMEADQSRVPLLLLTADRPPELRGVGANQTVDQAGLFTSAVRWWCDLGVPEAQPHSVRYWRSTVSRAVAVALGRSGGPAGPVHLNLPLREPLVPTGTDFAHPLDGRPDGAPWTASMRAPAPIPKPVRDRLRRARRGVVVAGDGLTGPEADALVDFAGRSGWPLVAEPHSGARRGPNALRCVDALVGTESFAPAQQVDVALVAGRAGLTRPVLGWLAGVPVLAVDRDGAWADPTRTAEAVVRADLEGLADVDGGADPGWLDSWLAAADATGSAVDALLDDEPALTEPLVARDVAAALPDGAALVVASSMPIRDLDLTMRPRSGLRIVANRGVSGIDGFVSTAIGVALAHDGPTWALAGDLSMLHDANGLLGDDRPNVTFVVVNNDGGGIFSTLPQGRLDHAEFEPLFGTPHGVDFARLAAVSGAAHRPVADRAGLAAALARTSDGVSLVEVRTDRRANARLHERLRAAAASALPA